MHFFQFSILFLNNHSYFRMLSVPMGAAESLRPWNHETLTPSIPVSHCFPHGDVYHSSHLKAHTTADAQALSCLQLAVHIMANRCRCVSLKIYHWPSSAPVSLLRSPGALWSTVWELQT